MFTKIYEFLKQFIKENAKSLIALLIIYLLFTIELPFAIYTPGGAINLANRIEIEDAYPEDGSFNMAYVSMVRGSLPYLLIARVLPDWDIEKVQNIRLDGENAQEMQKRERLDLEESQDNATINAYQEAGEELTILNTYNTVSYIANEAQTDLKVGDIILEVNDQPISSLSDLQSIITALNPKETVKIHIKRDNKEKDVEAQTYEAEDHTIKIGVMLLTTYDFETKKDIKISSKASEMGSSGGLMMSLEIYNRLTKEDITHGQKIVGTGTIDINGNIGEIGGVKYKLIDAVKKKAQVFICPEENYEEALKIVQEKKYDIKIISAHTFKEVLTKLEKLKNG